MTKKDIIRMAREAGWDINDLIDVFDFGVRLEAFANLVAAAERKACETAVEDIARLGQEIEQKTKAQRPWVGLTDDDWDKVGDMPDTFDQGVAWAQARLKERNNG